MITSMIFFDGRLIPNERDRLEAFKSTLTEGQSVTVEFSVNRHHSERAFKMLHALLGDLSRGLGIDKIRLKDQLCCLYGVAVPLSEALNNIPTWPGHLVAPWEDGKAWIRKSTTAYTVDEMNALISGAQLMALENDVAIGA